MEAASRGSMSFMLFCFFSREPTLPLRTTAFRAKNDQRCRMTLQNILQMSLYGLMSGIVISRNRGWIDIAAQRPQSAQHCRVKTIWPDVGLITRISVQAIEHDRDTAE